jgi:hypothetical protein
MADFEKKSTFIKNNLIAAQMVKVSPLKFSYMISIDLMCVHTWC